MFRLFNFQEENAFELVKGDYMYIIYILPICFSFFHAIVQELPAGVANRLLIMHRRRHRHSLLLTKKGN